MDIFRIFCIQADHPADQIKSPLQSGFFFVKYHLPFRGGYAMRVALPSSSPKRAPKRETMRDNRAEKAKKLF